MICFYIFVLSVVLVVHGHEYSMGGESLDQLLEANNYGSNFYTSANVNSLWDIMDGVLGLGSETGLEGSFANCPSAQQLLQQIQMLIKQFVGSLPNNCQCSYKK